MAGPVGRGRAFRRGLWWHRFQSIGFYRPAGRKRPADVFAEATGPGGSEPLAPASRAAPADLLWNPGPPALEPVAFVSLSGGSSQVSPWFWAFLPSQP